MVRRNMPPPPRRASWPHRLVYAVRAVSDRGWGILVLGGLLSIGRGWSYFGPTSPDRTPSQLVFLERLVPLGVYGVAWLIVGALCTLVVVLGQVPSLQQRASALVPHFLGLAVFLNAIWALSFWIAQWFQGVPRSYVSALSYTGLAFGLYLIGKMTTVEEAHP